MIKNKFIKFALIVLSSILTSCGGGSTTTTSTPSNTVFKIFVTHVAYNGNLGGIAGADQKCEEDVNCPSGKICKAMILSESRSINQDWVLQPNTTYTNLSGFVVGTTNNSAVFTFPLVSSIGTAGVDFGGAWTGSNGSFQLMSQYTCNNWTSNQAESLGIVGVTTALDSTVLNYTSNACNLTKGLYCVQQN